MLQTIPKYTTIKGVTIYRLIGGAPASTPAAVDVDINVSEQTHPTTDVSMMGTVGIPDQSRLDNFTVGVTINTDSPEAQALTGEGVVGWMICWVDEVVDATGIPSVVGWKLFVHGYVTGAPEATKNQGSDNTGELTMNCLAARKVNTLGYVAYDIDRRTNKLIRNGVDYRSKINALL